MGLFNNFKQNLQPKYMDEHQYRRNNNYNKQITKSNYQFNQIKTEIYKLENQRDLLLREIKTLKSKVTVLKEFEDFYADKNLRKIDEMTGLDFENFMAQLLKYSGYKNIEVTKSSGDQGIDILATLLDVKVGFQCKKFSKAVGNKAIQETYTGKAYYDLDLATVVTNNYFTQSAIELAEKCGVALWDRNKIRQLIDKKAHVLLE